MKSQTARTDSGMRETLGFGGFSPVVVPEVLGRDEEDPGLDILALCLAGRPWYTERVRKTSWTGFGFIDCLRSHPLFL